MPLTVLFKPIKVTELLKDRVCLLLAVLCDSAWNETSLSVFGSVCLSHVLYLSLLAVAWVRSHVLKHRFHSITLKQVVCGQ